MDKMKGWITKMLAGFFALMIVCTVVSRAAATAIVPEVTTANIKEGKLTVSVEGTGVIEAKKTRMVALPENVRVQETRKAGEQVEKGEPIVTCDLDYLKEQLQKKEAEVKKLQLQLESQEVSGTADARVSASESAARAWNRAQEDYLEAQKDYKAAADQEKSGKEKLKDKFEKAKKMAKEKRKTSEEEAKEKLNEALAQIETERKALNEKQQLELSAKEKESNELSDDSQTDMDAVNIQLQKLNERETEAQKEYSESLKQAQQEYEQSVAAAQQVYNTALAELKVNKSSAKDKTDSMEDVLNQAQDALDIAGMSDAADGQNQEKASRMNGLEQESTKIDLELLENEMDKIKKLIAADGIVKAPEDGVVEKNPVEAGFITTGQEVILLGYGGFQFKGELEMDDLSKLEAGDSIKISIAGHAEDIETSVEQVRSSADDMSFTAPFDGENLVFGASASYRMEKDTAASYQMRIPLGALREDDKGTYCLVLEEGSTVLGTEYTARRVNVTVEEKDEAYAAVTGNLGRDDDIITGSNKNIAADDRVRPAE